MSRTLLGDVTYLFPSEKQSDEDIRNEYKSWMENFPDDNITNPDEKVPDDLNQKGMKVTFEEHSTLIFYPDIYMDILLKCVELFQLFIESNKDDKDLEGGVFGDHCFFEGLYLIKENENGVYIYSISPLGS